jgi:hypothetical protein
MRKFWAAAAATMILAGAATAGERAAIMAPSDEPSVGIGMICNTAEQAKQYLDLRAGGADIKPAMLKVNAKAHDTRACGVAAIAYIRGETVASKAVHSALLQVVRVNVIAGYNGTGWQHVAGLIQYAVVASEGESI